MDVLSESGLLINSDVITPTLQLKFFNEADTKSCVLEANRTNTLGRGLAFYLQSTYMFIKEVKSV